MSTPRPKHLLHRLRQWFTLPPGLTVGVWRQARRLIIAVVGTTVLLIGVVLFFTPGPATVVIPAGLAILATEFVWARRLLNRLRASVASAANAVRGRDENPADSRTGLWRRWSYRLRRACIGAIEPFRPGFVDPYTPDPYTPDPYTPVKAVPPDRVMP